MENMGCFQCAALRQDARSLKVDVQLGINTLMSTGTLVPALSEAERRGNHVLAGITPIVIFGYQNLLLELSPWSHDYALTIDWIVRLITISCIHVPLVAPGMLVGMQNVPGEEPAFHPMAMPMGMQNVPGVQPAFAPMPAAPMYMGMPVAPDMQPPFAAVEVQQPTAAVAPRKHASGPKRRLDMDEKTARLQSVLGLAPAGIPGTGGIPVWVVPGETYLACARTFANTLLGGKKIKDEPLGVLAEAAMRFMEDDWKEGQKIIKRRADKNDSQVRSRVTKGKGKGKAQQPVAGTPTD